ncbi:hypothetical protein KR009_011860 [Drosophila setifemur]|nr:hypothetical protein KR009_011860 [Drosophila setifemur]
MFPLTRTQVASRAALKIFQLILSAFALRSGRQSLLVVWLRFCCWVCWYTLTWVHSIQYAKYLDCNMDCVLRFMLTIFQTGSHAFLVVNNLVKKLRCTQQEQRNEVVILEPSDPGVAFNVLGMILPVIGYVYLVYFNSWENSFRVRLFHLKVVPSFVALQLQIISFISEVMEVNVRVGLAKRQLQILARELSCRWPKKKENALYLDQQVYRIKALKRRYNELHEEFKRINVGFGVSLLIITIGFFLGFVCNAYWLFVDVRTRPLKLHSIVLNLGYIFNVALQMSAACWHCQQSTNLGRQIGCLISKLVKPLASKRYNDLVSEFSLQTLHQRFVVTAKDFFSLNLHLLCSMFAAVVTYLVILIQFMFAERSAKDYSG